MDIKCSEASLLKNHCSSSIPWTNWQRFDDALFFSEAGLMLGGQLILARSGARFGSSDDYLEKDDRLKALLAMAFRKKLSPHQMHHVAEAAGYSSRGDHALANIRLALAGLASVPQPDQLARRVSLSEQLLANGMSGDALIKALGLEPLDFERRYNPGQPRVPAGNGRASGQFGDGSGSAPPLASPTAASTSVALPLAGELSLLSPELSAVVLAALSTLAATVGVGAVLGAIFVPTANQVSSTGPLPGDLNVHYDYNHDEGVLRLIDTTGVKPLIVVAGQRDSKGIFRDADTGLPFAREIDDVLVFDATAMAAVADEEDEAEARARQAAASSSVTAKSQPKLCPDPSKDAPHGASPRSRQYQAFISLINNPQRPLPERWAVSLRNPGSGRLVYFDDCRESDGTMIEAKGAGFGRMLKSQYMRNIIGERWVNQGERQMAAAVDRSIDWFFADNEAAAFARENFEKAGLSKITVLHLPTELP